jgi:hypothetical protein
LLGGPARHGYYPDYETHLTNPTPESPMSASNVLRFSENFETMTFPECLAFISRSRRQIDRIEQLPQTPDELDTEELAGIRRGLDDLERRICSHPDGHTS